MNYVKTIVCLANSRKTAGRCIAGKEWCDGKPGDWVRPVSQRPTHELNWREMRYQDGFDPALLDVIAVPLVAPQPLPHQYENHVISDRYYWAKRGKLSWRHIQEWQDHPESLWGLGQSSYAGLNNRLSIGEETGLSLYLVATSRIRLWVGRKAPQYPDSKRAVRGEFVYHDHCYRMDVTDPNVESTFLAQADGFYDIHEPVLCVSLGDPWQGFYYKLIAAVLISGLFQ